MRWYERYASHTSCENCPHTFGRHTEHGCGRCACSGFKPGFYDKEKQMSDKVVQTTEEKVRAAAAACPTAAATLKTLFPDVFTGEVKLRPVGSAGEPRFVDPEGTAVVAPRIIGPHEGGIWLDHRYDWLLVDEGTNITLIAKYKQKTR